MSKADKNPNASGRASSPKTGQPSATPRRKVTAQVQNVKLVADRRERIIRAAVTVFHRQGFHPATTADITREAGLTQSNLYNYVQSKQDVLFLVFEHLISMYNDILDEVSAQFEDPHRRLSECLAALIHVMGKYHEEVHLLYSEINTLEGEDRLTFSAMVAEFIGRFEVLIEAYERSVGTTSIKDRRLAANLLSFAPAVIALRKWDLDTHPAPDREAEILRFIMQGVGIPVWAEGPHQ